MARGFVSIGRSGPRVGMSFRLPRVQYRWLPRKWTGENTYIMLVFAGIMAFGWFLQQIK